MNQGINESKILAFTSNEFNSEKKQKNKQTISTCFRMCVLKWTTIAGGGKFVTISTYSQNNLELLIF